MEFWDRIFELKAGAASFTFGISLFQSTVALVASSFSSRVPSLLKSLALNQRVVVWGPDFLQDLAAWVLDWASCFSSEWSDPKIQGGPDLAI